MFKIGDKVSFKEDMFCAVKNRMISKEEIMVIHKKALIKGTLYELRFEDGSTWLGFEHQLRAMK